MTSDVKYGFASLGAQKLMLWKLVSSRSAKFVDWKVTIYKLFGILYKLYEVKTGRFHHNAREPAWGMLQWWPRAVTRIPRVA